MSTTRVVLRRLSIPRSSAMETLVAGAGSAFGVTIVATGVALGSQIVLARTLGTQEFGVFAYVTAWMNILALAATLGTDSALVRLLPQYAAQADWPRFRGALRWSWRLTIAVSALLAGLTMLTAVSLSMDRSTAWTLGCGAAGLPLLGLVAVNQSALQGMKYIAHSQIPRLVLRPGLLGIALLPLWFTSADSIRAPTAMLVNFAALTVALIVGGWWIKRATPPAARVCESATDGGNWMRLSLPLCLISGVSVLLQESSVILIGWLDDPASAGIYSVAVRLVRLMALGMAAGNAISRPLFSELQTRNDRAELQRVTSLAALISLAGALACGVVLLAGRWLALGMFGPAFEAGAGVIAILAAGQLINAAMGPTSELLTMTGHERTSARILIMVALLSLVVGYPAIRFYGMTGAAVVASGIVCLQNLWSWFEVRRRIGVDSSPLGLLIPQR
jgi:O-antigen/teichoic acid export membrane protein